MATQAPHAAPATKSSKVFNPSRSQLRPKTLKNAKLIPKASKLREFFLKGPFYYQYVQGVGLSRVMICDNRPELEWIAEKLHKGAVVICRHLNVRV